MLFFEPAKAFWMDDRAVLDNTAVNQVNKVIFVIGLAGVNRTGFLRIALPRARLNAFHKEHSR